MVTVDSVRIQHIFRDPETGFTDALVLPRDAYDALDADAIEALKAERVAAHVAVLAEKPAPPTPEEEKAQAEAEAEDFLAQVEALESRKEALVARLDATGADAALVEAVDFGAKVTADEVAVEPVVRVR